MESSEATADARARRTAVFAWLAGLALLAAVVLVAGRRFEGVHFLRLMGRARGRWLAAAVILQLSTYLAQAEVWRAVARAAGFRVPVGRAYELSLSKLFVDQTLPSAGLSGTLFVAKSLERRGLPRPASVACVSINLVSYYLAYALALAAAALGAGLRGRWRGHLALAAGGFVLAGAAVAGAFLRLSRPAAKQRPGAPGRLRRAGAYLRDADPRLVRSRRLLLLSAAMQLAIIAADAATVWALVRSLGVSAPPARVYGSFMVSSVFRSVALSPGGLGAFEASSIYTLKRVGLPLPVALSATLLFRGLSFWLPMLPGLWTSRRDLRAEPSLAPASSGTDRPEPA